MRSARNSRTATSRPARNTPSPKSPANANTPTAGSSGRSAAPSARPPCRVNSAVREKAHDRPAPHAASDPAGSRRRAAGHPGVQPLALRPRPAGGRVSVVALHPRRRPLPYSAPDPVAGVCRYDRPGSICSRFPAAADGRARPPGPLLVRTLRVAAALLETAGPAAAPALPHPARLPALAPDFADRFRPLRRKSVKIPVFPLRNRPGKRLYRQISEIGGKKFRGNMYCRLKTGKTTIYLSQRQTDKKGNR